MNSNRLAPLPREAEQFLRRLGDLSRTAWLDIIDRSREPLTVTVRHLLRGLWLSILPARASAQSSPPYSRIAADRLKRLAKSGEFPVHRLNWRAYYAAGSALQALCNRATLQKEAVLEMYAPFEPHIPMQSLTTPGVDSSSAGSAGA